MYGRTTVVALLAFACGSPDGAAPCGAGDGKQEQAVGCEGGTLLSLSSNAPETWPEGLAELVAAHEAVAGTWHADVACPEAPVSQARIALSIVGEVLLIETPEVAGCPVVFECTAQALVDVRLSISAAIEGAERTLEVSAPLLLDPSAQAPFRVSTQLPSEQLHSPWSSGSISFHADNEATPTSMTLTYQQRTEDGREVMGSGFYCSLTSWSPR